MEERKRFVLGVLAGDFSIAELCEQFGVSRPTGYKWTSRFLERGEEGLVDRSRAPLRSPYRTSGDIEEVLVAFRRQHPHWSAKKVVASLRERMPEKPWPAASTVGGILKRRGLILSRRRRTRREHPGFRPMSLQRPNQLWTSDFKGQFRLGDSSYCYPLTVADRFSRYLLGCKALRGTFHRRTQEVFQRLFREYGLPEAILTDNGCPFASPGLVRLARLSVWFIRLDIQVLTIQPAHPEQNGSHERMHRTLKEETTRPPAPTAAPVSVWRYATDSRA